MSTPWSSELESSEWSVYGLVNDGIPRMLMTLSQCPWGGCLGQAYDPTLGTCHRQTGHDPEKCVQPKLIERVG